MERTLKDRFQNNWDSVRKAFLGLDSDYDGYITVEDILRYFGTDQASSKEFNFNDLKKLIHEKDHLKQGKIGYADFSKWVGNSIHQSEGFYFRHDSVKNPQYDLALEKSTKHNTQIQEVSKSLITNEQNLEKTILDKIKFQWKTIRKAFCDLNKEKTGTIMADELRFYFKHWGLQLNDEQFDFIFKKFDYDGDGKISYKDFHRTVGSEIHPGESLYFRQDKPHMSRITKCHHDKCWQPTVGQYNFCSLHLKLYIDKMTEFYQSWFIELGTDKWNSFLAKIRDKAEKDDQNLIEWHEFLRVIEEFKIEFKDKDKKLLLETFPGRSEGDKTRINIQKLYDTHQANQLKKMYKKVNIEDTDEEDVAIDIAGYLGQFHRPQNKDQLQAIGLDEVARVVAKSGKLVDIMRAIKEIDREHNGYVTSTELDDIIKLYHKSELKDKNLKQLFKPYASIQNKILIDYKRFRDHLIMKMKEVKEVEIVESDMRMEDLRKQKRDFYEKMVQRIRSKKNSEIPVKIDSQREEQPRLATVVTNQHTISRGRNQTLLSEPSNLALIREQPKRAKSRDRQLSTIIPDHQVSIYRVESRNESLDSQIKIKLPSRPQTNQLNFRNMHQRKFTLSNSTIDQTLFPNGSTYIAEPKHLDEDNAYGTINNKPKKSVVNRVTSQLVEIQADNRSSIQHLSTGASHNLRPASQCSIKTVSTKNAGDHTRKKLEYEWKNVYRQLNSSDLTDSGAIPSKKFEQALRQTGVFISKEDLTKLRSQFGNSQGYINYEQLSRDYGFHSKTLDLMRQTHSKIKRLKTAGYLTMNNERNNTSIGGRRNINEYLSSSGKQQFAHSHPMTKTKTQ